MLNNFASRIRIEATVALDARGMFDPVLHLRVLTFLELWALIDYIRRFAPLLKSVIHLKLWEDNHDTSSTLKSIRTCSLFLMKELRALHSFFLKIGISIDSALHSSAVNCFADRISRLIPSEYWRINYILYACFFPLCSTIVRLVDKMNLISE